MPICRESKPTIKISKKKRKENKNDHQIKAGVSTVWRFVPIDDDSSFDRRITERRVVQLRSKKNETRRGQTNEGQSVVRFDAASSIWCRVADRCRAHPHERNWNTRSVEFHCSASNVFLFFFEENISCPCRWLTAFLLFVSSRSIQSSISKCFSISEILPHSS